MSTPYAEYTDSQQPALQLLQNLGYEYISPKETEQQRNDILSQVVLADILEQQLHKLNSYEYKEKTYNFSEENIHSALQAMKNIPDQGLRPTNEKVYDLLTLGKSFEESLPKGDRKSFTLQYIDWEKPENNVYHVTEEFYVEGLNQSRKPDIVLFVNGIPFVVIENKRRDKNQSVKEAIQQHQIYQDKEEGIPRLYHYAQLLLAVQPNKVQYGATGTKRKFWSIWKEDHIETEVKQYMEGETPRQQDRSIYCLCRPERLLELCYTYTVFENQERKVARYQQYFAVQNSLERIKQRDKEGNREGGVIWHTQGSGKSITMVMLSKAIALKEDIEHPRVLIVTDRIDLDKQIYKTFNNCGKKALKAKSGNHLVKLLKNESVEVMTTVIAKFDSAMSQQDFENTSRNIFVLVDESHRTQYGKTHALMKKALPNACYIGFTGTPLMKREKNTARKFGGFIDTYTIDEAVNDEAVLPLLYESRAPKLSVDREQIDKYFDRVAEPLTEYQEKELKQRFTSIFKLYNSEQIIEEIAHDIKENYTEHWQGTGFKAQLAVPYRSTALRYYRKFEEETNSDKQINSAVIISPPDQREGLEFGDDEEKHKIQEFWKRIKEEYGSGKQYEESMISKFKSASDDVELLIVVGKLLTGFDAPRNTVLYLAKPLKEHNLLQAIARVNRLFEGKDYGHIVDYVGLLGELDEALTQYSALEDFDEEDLKGTVHNIRETVEQVPQKHTAVWDIFKGVGEGEDENEQNELMERHLAPEDRREKFYDKLSDFARTLQTAFSSDYFWEKYSDKRIDRFKSDLKRFQSLRNSVKNRYAEDIDYAAYETRIRKLLDTHVGVKDIDTIGAPINIFDDKVFKEQVEEMTGEPASKADTIAHRMKKEINERIEEDPVFYKKFSKLIEELIEKFQAERISEQKYLEEVMSLRDRFVKGVDEDIPQALENKPKVRAFYGALQEMDNAYNNGHLDTETLIEAAQGITDIVKELAIRDWQRNPDVQKEMKNQVEDYILDNQLLDNNLSSNEKFEAIDFFWDDYGLQVAKNNF